MTAQQRIRLARRHAALSQAQLADVVGVQRSAVSHWEAPEGKNPSVKHLREVALSGPKGRSGFALGEVIFTKVEVSSAPDKASRAL